MAIVKKKSRQRFCAISNELLQDASISFGARGLLAYLLSKPDDWQCTMADIEREGGIKETARRALMIEAERAGYLTFERRREHGRFVSCYDVHEEPVPEAQRTQSWEMGKKAQQSEITSPVSAAARANSKTPTKVTNSKRADDPLYMAFCGAYEQRYGTPYMHKTADFVQLANLRRKGESKNFLITPERWGKAVLNYFASEDMAGHTLADLASRFSVFFKHPLDRFGKALVPATIAGQTIPAAALSSKTRGNAAAVEGFLQGGAQQ